MKKLLFLVFIMMMGLSSYSQNREVIFEESFDNSVFPAGWNIMGVGLSNWSIVSTTQAGASPNELHLSWEPEFEGITRLVSPVIDLTGVSTISIQFSHNLYFWQNQVILGIATTSDNGATWHEGWSFVYTNHSEVTVISETIATEDVGSSNFRFCIFVDAHSFNFDDWWFDNISVFNMVNIDAEVTNILVDDQKVAGFQDVACVVGNVGEDHISTIELNYQFGENEVVTEFFDVDLASFTNTELSFQEQVMVDEGVHELKVWISKVNGSADGSAINDTLTKEINVTLGQTVRNPMIELFSASTCAPCVGVNQEVLELMAQNSGRYAISKYQMNWPGSGDPYYTAEGGTRKTYYGVTGVPAAFIDGTEFYPYTQEEFDNSANEKSFVEIKGSFHVEGTTIQAAVDVMSYGALTNATLYVIVNEKVTYNNVGSNGETEFHHVMMKFLPDVQGTVLNLTAGENQHLEFTANLTSTHIEEFDDLEVSAFVQDYSTKYVYNSHFLYEYSTIHPFAPTSLLLTENPNNMMTATWSAPEGNNQTGYDLFIDGELILDNTDATSYTGSLTNGFHIVEVMANYPEEHTSVRLAKSIIISGITGVSDLDIDPILVYPNPAKEIVNIKGTDVAKITIYDGYGRRVDSFIQKETIDVSRYLPGVYYINIESEEGKYFVKKLVIKAN